MISAIVPTIGRPASLEALLASLTSQSTCIHEVIISDAGDDDGTAEIASDPRWPAAGIVVRHFKVTPPNAVRQREIAIEASFGEYLLLLDDDVVLEHNYVERMVALFEDPSVVAVFGNFNNESWPMPTRIWRFYLRYLRGFADGEWQGRVVGPLLRFGFEPVPSAPVAIEWLGTGNSLVSRAAYKQVGGFSDFFLHRCTINEDVDLGIRLSRVGKILFCPGARVAHHHDPRGRVSVASAAEDDLYNRFFVLHRTVGKSWTSAFALILTYYIGETLGNLMGCLTRGGGAKLFVQRFHGRSRAVGLLIAGAMGAGAHPKRSPDNARVT